MDRIIAETNEKISKHTAAYVTVLKTSSEKNLYLDDLKAEVADLL